MSLLHRGSKGSAGARAQIVGYHDDLTIRGSGGGGMGQTMGGISQTTALHTTFRMRVVPDDGQAEFEAAMSVWGTDAGHLQAARWTYVTYDPDDCDHCHLDKDRVRAEFGAERGREHAVMVPKDVGDSWYRSAGPAPG